MQKLGNPVPLFLDTTGALLDGGHIYVGIVDGDPEASPIDLFWDVALTVPASQPLRTIGGLIVNGTTPAAVFISQDDYSMRVTDAQDVLVAYSPSVYTNTSGFQPLDSDLTAIAALGTTAYGRALLTLANQAALQSAVGYTPFTGGTVITNIVRSSAGVYPYWADAAMTGGRIFSTVEGAADPTSQPGDIWFELEA
jgi:hypothetical protein